MWRPWCVRISSVTKQRTNPAIGNTMVILVTMDKPWINVVVRARASHTRVNHLQPLWLVITIVIVLATTQLTVTHALTLPILPITIKMLRTWNEFDECCFNKSLTIQTSPSYISVDCRKLFI